MKQISLNVYEHEGIKAEVVARITGRPCNDCPFDLHGRPCPLPGKTCTPIIGADKVFRKYKEPETVKKVKLCDVSFKCAVLTPERNKILRDAALAVGCSYWEGVTGENRPEAPFIFVTGGIISAGDTAGNFVLSRKPELTYQQALDLLATVEKPEPVFDIKLRDEVLCRDAAEAWEIKNFARTRGDCSNFATFGARYLKMIRFAGNEQYHGSKDTPPGWWESRDGKPVWVTK